MTDYLNKSLDVTPAEAGTLERLLKSKGVDMHELQPLFDAKQHGDKAADYHRLCDGAAGTVTLVRATDGSLFGGSRQVPITNCGRYMADPAAFLFSVDFESTCHQYQHQDKAIYDSSSRGPIFGSGFDLVIYSNCLTN
jgi:hypothetical protein